MRAGAGIRTLISTGPGRLHLMLSASALLESGEDVRVITGWAPGPCTSKMVAIASQFGLMKNLASRLDTRARCDGFPRERVLCCPIADGVNSVAHRLIAADKPFAAAARCRAWHLFGRASCRHIKDADIFHVRSGAGGGGAISTARKRGLAVVVDHSIAHPSWMATALNDEYASYGSRSPFARNDPFWQAVEDDCSAADAVLVNSDFVAETFTQEGFPKDQLRVAYLGVAPEWFGLKRDYTTPNGPLNLLFVGEFGVRKGAGYLLDALNKLDPERKRFRLLVVGRTPEMPLLTRRHKVSSHDRFIGQLAGSDVRSIAAKADAFVFPSLAEGCARAAMEAMAAGLPVIATRETGLPAEPGKHAMIVASRSVDSLCDALLAMSNNEQLRFDIGAAGAGFAADRFCWPRYGQQVQAIHADVLKASGG
jgi:glycosyltransferase involved in cell wall biosynthesis